MGLSLGNCPCGIVLWFPARRQPADKPPTGPVAAERLNVAMKKPHPAAGLSWFRIAARRRAQVQSARRDPGLGDRAPLRRSFCPEIPGFPNDFSLFRHGAGRTADAKVEDCLHPAFPRGG